MGKSRLKRRLLLTVLTSSLLLPLASAPNAEAAAIPVVEVGAQLVQSTITAVQSVIQVANQVLELTPLDDMVLDGAWVEDMRQLEEVVAMGSHLAWDLASLDAQITALFALEAAPTTAEGLNAHMAEIRGVIVQSYSYAMRTQVLIQTALRTVGHLLALVDRVLVFIGNMQANQTLTEQHGKLAQLLTEQKVTTTALQRAQSVEALQTPVIIESLRRINEARMADHPRR
jgi:conjugal transfer/entry exclusion protein